MGWFLLALAAVIVAYVVGFCFGKQEGLRVAAELMRIPEIRK